MSQTLDSANESDQVEQIELLLSDVRGVYIPRDFANELSGSFCYPEGTPTTDIHGAEVAWEGDMMVLREGPDKEVYWDVWQFVLDHASCTREPWLGWTLWHDGDLFVVGPDWKHPESEEE